MVNFLVCPATPSSWRIDPTALDQWLSSRWPDIERASDAAARQRAHVWTWSDRSEVWLPDDLECCWIAGDAQLIAAVAAHMAVEGPADLTLCDEGYNYDVRLTGLSEDDLLGRL